jgi:hypothetical protein
LAFQFITTTAAHALPLLFIVLNMAARGLRKLGNLCLLFSYLENLMLKYLFLIV